MGVTEEQFSLGLVYAMGQGISQEDVQAHRRFNLAVSRATGALREDAVEARDFAAGQMDPTQIAEAQRLAREWDAAHPREP